MTYPSQQPGGYQPGSQRAGSQPPGTQQAGYWTPTTAPQFGSTRAPSNTFAWIGLIVSVSGFIFNLGINGLVGIAFSILGLRDARRLAAAGHEQTGRSIALAGLITGIAQVIVTAGLIVLAVFSVYWFNDWLLMLINEVEAQQS